MFRLFVSVVFTILALVSLTGNAASRIELVDGTVIIGDVLSMSSGSYVIRTATLGQIAVSESAIRSIRPGGDSGSVGALGTELSSIQQGIVGSPELMQAVTALQSDPELQAVLKDPELLQLVLSGNLDALQDDPRFRRLLENSSIQSIVGKMSSQ